MYRGWLRLDDIEIANSARVIAHLGVPTPTSDAMVWGTPDSCVLADDPSEAGLFQVPDSCEEIEPGLGTPPNGSRLYDPGLYVVGECWSVANLCGGCRPFVSYDDSWTGLQDFLGDSVYRPELAPWYRIDIPESAEFGGIWIMDTDGFGPAPVVRPITELVNSGATAGPHRDASRTLKFTALLIGCTNAGVSYGLEWLACVLRETKARTDATLRYLTAHPGYSTADPSTLVRELHGVVLTKSPDIDESFTPTRPNSQATMYRVTWEMVALRPHAYAPPIVQPAYWDYIIEQPIQWVHAADCEVPESCAEIPVLFGDECAPEQIDVSASPPPACGGCFPLCAINTYVFTIPNADQPIRCDETAVTITITNYGDHSLTIQAYWQLTYTPAICEDHHFPVQVTGLPPRASLVLDAVTARYHAVLDGRKRRPVGIVSTPDGAPWEPPVIDRNQAWQMVVLAATGSEFDVVLSLADREA